MSFKWLWQSLALVVSDNTISVVGDNTLDAISENVIKNCAVTNGLNTKQDKLCEGRAICITGNCIAVKVDNFMDCTSTNPVANCVINKAIDCIMSCGYQAGNGIAMTTDQCGCHVISLADCVNVVEYIYATSGSSVPFISFCIEEVDISRPWCIEEYDGAEGIKYLDAYKCVDMFIHFCPCPYLLNINL